jgi:hypothetical protein
MVRCFFLSRGVVVVDLVGKILAFRHFFQYQKTSSLVEGSVPPLRKHMMCEVHH